MLGTSHLVQTVARMLSVHLRHRSSAAGMSISECYELFFMNEHSGDEELRSAYEVTVKRNSNNIEQVKLINLAYHKILTERRKQKAELGEEETGPKQRYVAAKFRGGSINKFVELQSDKAMRDIDFTENPLFGKPLPKKYESPYVNPMERKLNEILIKHDVGTEWMEIQKEIQIDLKDAKYVLKEYYQRHLLDPENKIKAKKFQDVTKDFYDNITKINKLVEKFNLHVPVPTMQRVLYQADKEYHKVLDEVKRTGVK